MAIGTVLTALSLIKDGAPALASIAERFIDGRATKAELTAEAEKHVISSEVQLAIAQIQLNTKEAEHSSVFVSGWRPFVGWVCGLAMAFNFLITPILVSFGFIFEPLDLSIMMPVLLGMLGIGGLRTFEKTKGVHRNSMKNNLDNY